MIKNFKAYQYLARFEKKNKKFFSALKFRVSDSNFLTKNEEFNI